MKKLFLLLGVVALTFFAPAVSADFILDWSEEGIPSADVVKEIPGKQTKEIYQLSKLWFAKEFVSARSVIQIDDPEKFVIAGRGICNVVLALAVMRVEFFLQISAKNGKVRYQMNQFVNLGTAQHPTREPWPVKGFKKQVDKFNSGLDIDCMLLYVSLVKSLTNGSAVSTNW